MLAIVLYGCTPAYVQEGKGSNDLGYNERKFSDETFHVWAATWAFGHDSEYDSVFTRRRCAELALEHGFRYFVFMSKDNRQTVFRDVDENFLKLVFQGEVVRFLSNKDVPGAQDAIDVISKTDKDAGGRLSQKARRTMKELGRQKASLEG